VDWMIVTASGLKGGKYAFGYGAGWRMEYFDQLEISEGEGGQHLMLCRVEFHGRLTFNCFGQKIR